MDFVFPDLSGFLQWAFFNELFEDIDEMLAAFQSGMLQRMYEFITLATLSLVTIWIIMQGFLIITGRSREPLMGLVVNSLKIVLIVFCAIGLTRAGTDVHDMLTEKLPQHIHYVVTGDEENVAKAIDDNLTRMGFIFALFDAIPVGKEGEGNANQQQSITSLAGIGIAGPAVIGGAMLLLYKIAMVLFVGFGPLFILCLLFDQTKELFKRWLLYGLGTMFSMAVLAFMVSVAMEVVETAALRMLQAYILSTVAGLLSGAIPGLSGLGGFGSTAGLNSAAMVQGGVGLVMSVLMVMSPPMAAMFFSGTLGQFAAHSSFGNVGRNSSGSMSDFKTNYDAKGGTDSNANTSKG